MPSTPLQPTFFDLIRADEAAELAQQAPDAETHQRYEKEQEVLSRLGQDTRQLRSTELLAMLTGMSEIQAEEVLKKAGGMFELAQMPEPVLASLPHVGPKRAHKIKAMTEWAVRLSVCNTNERMHLRSPSDAASLVMLEMGLLEREQLRVIGVDTKNNVNFIETIYHGSLNTAVVRIVEVLREAIIRNCASIILVHNHPSGDPTPSPEDVRLTEMIKEAGEAIDINVLDHIIIGRNRFVSLKERGLAFR